MEEQSAESVQTRRNELIHKCISLQVLKELTQKNETTIEEKRILLARETNELDKLHQDVWSLQGKMCDEVWDFSARYDFNGIFNDYPNIPAHLFLNCDCDGEESVKENVEAQQLRAEIEEIRSILDDGSHDLLKEDLSRAEKELCECKRESPDILRLRREINEAKGRIANLKRKIETNCHAIQDNTHDYVEIENEIVDFRDFSHDSSATANCPQSRNLSQLHSTQSVFPKNNNYYNCLTRRNSNSNHDSGFVRASTLINEESQSQFNKIPRCEKIIAEAVSNDEKLSATTNQTKKKFVFKTKSHITQGKKR